MRSACRRNTAARRLEETDCDPCSVELADDFVIRGETGPEVLPASPAKPEVLPVSPAKSDESTDFESGASAACSTSDIDVGNSFEDAVVFLFDWDDTLCPTSWICKEGIFPEGTTPSNEQCAELTAVTESAALLIREAQRLGKVIIVTNSRQGWVEYSCKRFLSKLQPAMEDVEIVSARQAHEHDSDDPTERKRLTFNDLLDAVVDQGPARRRLDAMSVGDSTQELRALQACAQERSDCLAKTVKLMDRPLPRDLCVQLDALCGRLAGILGGEVDIDLEVADWL